MFNLIKITLIKFNLYNFIRHSSLYYLILKFKNPSYTKSLNKDFLFFNKILKKKKLIFDVGSNQGDKAFVFSKIGQKIILFEPDKICCDFLENRFKNFKNILIEKIVLTGRKAEKKSFITVENNSSYNSLNLKRINFLKNNFKYLLKRIYIKTKSINFYIKKYGIPNFLKIDTEGSEYEIIKSIKKEHKPLISCICFEANLPLFFKETLMIISLFPRSSFNLRIWNKYNFVYHKNINAKDLKLYLRNKKITYDIFIFNI